VARTAGCLAVVVCPFIPQLLSDTDLVASAVNRELGGGQSCWPDAWSAASISLTASLELLDSLAACLPSSPISHPNGSKQHSREVEACSAALRSFAISALPLGSYTGQLRPPRDSGDPKGRPQQQQQGGAASDSATSVWAQVPHLLTGGGGKQAHRLQLSVTELVDASLPSQPQGGSASSHPTVGALSRPCIRLRGRLEVASEGKPLSKVGVPIRSSGGHAFIGLALDRCVGTSPPIPAGEPLHQVTLSLVPLPSMAFVAAYYAVEPPIEQPPFTGRYSIQAKPGSNSKAFRFSMELLYHPPATASAAVVEQCSVQLGMPRLVSSIESTTASVGTLSLQDSRLVWQNLGSGRINGRSARATCSGTATLAAVANQTPDALVDTDVLPTGLSLQQAVAGCWPARVRFLIKGATLTGAEVNKAEVSVEPLLVKEVSVESIREVRSGDYTIWSLRDEAEHR